MKTPRLLLAYLATIFVLGVASAASASETDDAPRLIAYPEDDTADLGQGWNLHTGRSASDTCIINFEPFTTVKNTVEADWSSSNNEFELGIALGLTMNEQLNETENASGFGLKEKESGSESSSASFRNKFSVEKNDRYIHAKQVIVSKWNSVKSKEGTLIKLNAAAAELYWSDRQAFYAQCGHGYVSRIEYGGRFDALVTFSKSTYKDVLKAMYAMKVAASESAGTTSETDSKDSKDSGSGVGESAGTKDSYSGWTDDNLKNVLEKTEVSISEKGGKLKNVATTWEKLAETYAEWPQTLYDSPTEFRLAVTPYPAPKKPEGAAEGKVDSFNDLDAPYAILVREESKWRYLEATTGRMISAYHESDSKGADSTVLENLKLIQQMSQDKLGKIGNVVKACRNYVKANDNPIQSELAQVCSLKGLQVTFSTRPEDREEKCDNAVVCYKDSASKVDVMESDVYYLARLPVSFAVYPTDDAKNKTVLTYRDQVYNQVNGIYRERCSSTAIPNFCETEGLVDAVVSKYNAADIAAVDINSGISIGSSIVRQVEIVEKIAGVAHARIHPIDDKSKCLAPTYDARAATKKDSNPYVNLKFTDCSSDYYQLFVWNGDGKGVSLVNSEPWIRDVPAGDDRMYKPRYIDIWSAGNSNVVGAYFGDPNNNYEPNPDFQYWILDDEGYLVENKENGRYIAADADGWAILKAKPQ